MKEENDVQRNRERFVIDMRKAQREEKFKESRKRNAKTVKTTSGDSRYIVVDQRYQDMIQKYVFPYRSLLATQYSPAELAGYCRQLASQDVETLHRAVIAIRKIISGENEEPKVQEVIDSGAVPMLIALMQEEAFPQLQFESCWIITNIASGSNAQCQSIVEKGCIDVLIKLLYENRPYTCEQAIWGLGNIAGDCTKFRDAILMKGGHECLIRMVEGSSNTRVIRQGVWALSNLCRSVPLPKYEIIKPIIPLLCKTISMNILAGEELIDALWAIANNSEGLKSRIQRILQVPAFPPKLIELCYSEQLEKKVPCLRIIGNISTGNEGQTEVLLRLDVLRLLEGLLDHEKTMIRRECCWTISNICAGSKRQILQVHLHPSMLFRLSVLLVEDSCDVKREICYIFGNMCHMGDVKLVYSTLVNLKIVEHVLAIITADDQEIKMLEVALTALFDFLGLGERVQQPNPFLQTIKNTFGCIDKLEHLQYHKSMEIYRIVVKIMQRFFTLEDQNLS